MKDHDFQFWAPLRFDAAGKMINVSWIDSFDVELAPPYPPPPPPPTPAPAWYGCSYEVRVWMVVRVVLMLLVPVYVLNTE